MRYLPSQDATVRPLYAIFATPQLPSRVQLDAGKGRDQGEPGLTREKQKGWLREKHYQGRFTVIAAAT